MVFSLTPPKSPGSTWTEAILYNFTGGSDGGFPEGVVIGSGSGGHPVLYGVTTFGGTGACSSYVSPYAGCGTVFSLTPPASPGGPWTQRVLYSFAGGTDGSLPTAGMVIGNAGALYGTTSAGGAANNGTVFSLTPPSAAPSVTGGDWTEAVLYNFNCGRGCSPEGVVIAGGGVLYGTTQYGGTGCPSFPGGCGEVFSLTPPKAGLAGPWTEAVLYSFTASNSGSDLPSGVVIGGGGVLYGTTASGGPSELGTVFALTPPATPGGTWTESVLCTFTDTASGTGYYPGTGVAVGSGGVLYGTLTSGGGAGSGGVFSLTPPASGLPRSGGAWTVSALYGFTSGGFVSGGGLQAFSGLAIGMGGVIYGAIEYDGPANSGAVYSLTPPTGASSGPSGAWNQSMIYAFTGGSPGSGTLSGLAIGSNGVLYGTTVGGGTGSCPLGCGTVFSLTPPAGASSGSSSAWTENLLYSFTGGSDGAYPTTGVVTGSGGVLYGTAEYGGTGPCAAAGQPRGCGVVFSLTPPTSPGGPWSETTLHSFYIPNEPCSGPEFCAGYSDGAYPATGVVIGADGVLYGTTMGGGTTTSGTVFSLTLRASPFGDDWTEAVLYNFFSRVESYPVSAGPSSLAIGGGNVLYGTTSGGNPPGCPLNCGTVFSLTPPVAGPSGAWTETLLQGFAPYPALPPSAGVAIGSGGVLYGTVPANASTVPAISAAVFSLTPSEGVPWPETLLYNFGANVGSPSGLVVGSGGVLYGTTQYGGSGPCTAPGIAGCGTVFALIPPAAEATLYNFTGGSDGAFPLAGTVIGSWPDGSPALYGTTGGMHGGTVFSLTVRNGLAPSISPGGVVNAASYTAPVAPGSIASAFGNFLLLSPLGAGQSPLPDDISGLSLQFAGGTQAPLFFASGGQVNFQVSWELSNESPSTLTASLDNAASAAQAVNVAPVSPAIFSTDSSGSGQGAILDTSYRLVDSSNPADAGSTIVLIYCTGLGAVSNQPATGSPAPSSPLLARSATPTVTIGGSAASVQFSGLAPGYVGLYQVNAQVPAGSATGPNVSVVISMGGMTSNTVTMAVQ